MANDILQTLSFSIDDAIKRFGDYGRTSDTDPRLVPKSDNWYAIALFGEWKHIGEVVSRVVVDTLPASGFPIRNEDLTEWNSEFARFTNTVGNLLDGKVSDLFGELSHDEAFTFWNELSIFATRASGASDALVADTGLESAVEAIQDSIHELPDRIGNFTSELAELLGRIVSQTLGGALSGLVKGLGIVGVVVGIVASALTIRYFYNKGEIT